MDPIAFAAEVAEMDEVPRHERLLALATDPADAMRVADALLAADQAQALAADILNQVIQASPESSPEAVERLIPLLDGSDPDTLSNAVVALGHAAGRERPGASRAKARIIELARHPDEDVRYAVAWALPKFRLDRGLIDTLIVLSRDTDDDVRDWATFGLARQIDAEGDEITAALLARLDDTDTETRIEAAHGLASRGHPAAKQAVAREIVLGARGFPLDEAAEMVGLTMSDDPAIGDHDR